MRYLASVAIGLILLLGAWLVKDGSVFTTGYQPPPDAPATIGTWVNIGPAPLSYIDIRETREIGIAGALRPLPSILTTESLAERRGQRRCVGERRWRHVVAPDYRFGTDAGSYTMTVTSVNSCGTSVASSPVTVVVP